MLSKSIFFFFSLLVYRAASQPSVSPSIFELMTEQQYTKMTLLADFDDFRANRFKEHRQAAVLEFSDRKGAKERWDIQIEVRGKYRRRICDDMPPIRLIFPKETLRKQHCKTAHRKYKLVTHCLENDGSDQTVLKEYWAYQMYERLSPHSFKTNLLEITYLNTADRSTTHHMGFIIENEKELAARIGGKRAKTWGLSQDSIQQASYQNMLLFQYMIGNTDWGIPMLRNLILVRSADNKTLAIPYDFDASGLVDAPYALPNPNLRQKDIRQRIAMGTFDDAATLGLAAERFLVQYKQAWCFEECTYLDRAAKKDMDDYLSAFLRLLENEKRRNKVFLERK
ncbi:MAG: hypothetical protein AAF847_06955 [Bacteroidota bacterium]